MQVDDGPLHWTQEYDLKVGNMLAKILEDDSCTQLPPNRSTTNAQDAANNLPMHYFYNQTPTWSNVPMQTMSSVSSSTMSLNKLSDLTKDIPFDLSYLNNTTNGLTEELDSGFASPGDKTAGLINEEIILKILREGVESNNKLSLEDIARLNINDFPPKIAIEDYGAKINVDDMMFRSAPDANQNYLLNQNVHFLDNGSRLRGDLLPLDQLLGSVKEDLNIINPLNMPNHNVLSMNSPIFGASPGPTSPALPFNAQSQDSSPVFNALQMCSKDMFTHMVDDIDLRPFLNGDSAGLGNALNNHDNALGKFQHNPDWCNSSLNLNQSNPADHQQFPLVASCNVPNSNPIPSIPQSGANSGNKTTTPITRSNITITNEASTSSSSSSTTSSSSTASGGRSMNPRFLPKHLPLPLDHPFRHPPPHHHHPHPPLLSFPPPPQPPSTPQHGYPSPHFPFPPHHVLGPHPPHHFYHHGPPSLHHPHHHHHHPTDFLRPPFFPYPPPLPMRHSARNDSIMRLRLDDCYEQFKQIEKERKKTEADLARHNPGKKLSSANNYAVPRLPPNPSRVDRLIVDQRREHARVATLIRKMNQLLSGLIEKQHPEIMDGVAAWNAAIDKVDMKRRDEQINLQTRAHLIKPEHIEREILDLADSIRKLEKATQRARTCMWCCLKLTIHRNESDTNAVATSSQDSVNATKTSTSPSEVVPHTE